MSQPNDATQQPKQVGLGAESRKGKKEKIEGGFLSLVGKLTRKLVWVFSGLIFAGVFFWGLIEIAIAQSATVKVDFLGKTGTFTLDRFALFAGILALIPPAIMYFIDSRRRDS